MPRPDPRFEILSDFTILSGPPRTGTQPSFEVIPPETDFQVQSRGQVNTVTTPKGTSEHVWWFQLDTNKRIGEAALEPIRASLLRQTAQTCWPTACLNAWILRGALSPQEAATVQQSLLTDPVYKRYYAPGTEHWEIANPAIPAYAIREILGREVGFAWPQQEAASSSEVAAVLRRGYIAVVGTAEHYRTIFQPGDYPGKLAVVDPLRPELPQLYEADRAPRLLPSIHTVKNAVII
jgi:hypothetical protein